MRRLWEKFRAFAEEHPELAFWLNLFILTDD